jgi:hypothetical protein
LGLAPYSQWNPILPGQKTLPARDQFIRSKNDPGPVPTNDEDIAFASVTQLSRWIEQRKLTSERLTNLYLERLEKYNPTLRCAITITRELALAQAKRADQESPPENIAARCTVSHGEAKIFSTPPASPPPMVPSPSGTVFPQKTPP